jgi:hypothetical protein
MKPKSIDELGSAKPGSFAKFLKQKSDCLQKNEDWRKARIRSKRSVRELSLAA